MQIGKQPYTYTDRAAYVMSVFVLKRCFDLSLFIHRMLFDESYLRGNFFEHFVFALIENYLVFLK